MSRILFEGRLFDYPLELGWTALRRLGLGRTARIGASYLAARARPVRPERSLEDFYRNRFGDALYRLFFRAYTEKVWGAPCRDIPAEWGAQRVKGLSLRRAALDAARHALFPNRSGAVETSLIRRFHYPALGPGQMWEAAAARVERLGGRVFQGQRVVALRQRDGRIVEVRSRDEATGATRVWACEQVFSSLPVRELIAAIEPAPPEPARRAAQGLRYRNFLTVGLLLDRLELGAGPGRSLAPDHWIYLQDPALRAGRLQIFNNWSLHLVADPTKVWIGLEYFTGEDDDLWRAPDALAVERAVQELAAIGALDPRAVRDAVVLRAPQAYPAYLGTYGEFGGIREWLDTLENLFPIGRNGTHRYNNMDHSMLSAMAAVQCALDGAGKARVWAVNAEGDYHESLPRDPSTAVRLGEWNQLPA